MYILKLYLIRYTLTKTQMLKKFPSDKINVTKNAPFFLLRAPTHHSFTFNLRYTSLYNCVWDFPFFDFALFLLKFLLLFNKMHRLFDFKTP